MTVGNLLHQIRFYPDDAEVNLIIDDERYGVLNTNLVNEIVELEAGDPIEEE